MDYSSAVRRSIHSFRWHQSREVERWWDHHLLESVVPLLLQLWWCSHSLRHFRAELHRTFRFNLSRSLHTCSLRDVLSPQPSLVFSYLSCPVEGSGIHALSDANVPWIGTRVGQCVLFPIAVLIMLGSVLVFLARVVHIETISSRNAFQSVLSLFSRLHSLDFPLMKSTPLSLLTGKFICPFSGPLPSLRVPQGTCKKIPWDLPVLYVFFF